jgi:hydroxyproline O-arabinosyltransferase
MVKLTNALSSANKPHMTRVGTAQAMLETRGNAHFGRSNGTSNTQGEEDAIHTLATSNGSPYQNYQMRIAYATYKLVQAMPGGERHVAFTRILHRTQPDALMDEMPTFRADPLQPACDEWCEYPVSDRANAVRQFFEAAAKNTSMIKAKWLYMIESE